MQKKPTLIQKKNLVAVFILVFLTFTISASSFPQKAHAFLGIGDVVFDPLNTFQGTINAAADIATQLKGYVLDPLAWIL
jgi:hypothetical protein